MICDRRIKLHVFEPSGRIVWTVVGTDREYWTDPSRGFCSCPGYYYGRSDRGCYHLEAVRHAELHGGAETIRLADCEYAGFVSCIMYDMK